MKLLTRFYHHLKVRSATFEVRFPRFGMVRRKGNPIQSVHDSPVSRVSRNLYVMKQAMDKSSGFANPRVFYTCKAGESEKDYQDACAYNLDLRRFAIADGATGAFMSAIWSKLLVKRFCEDEDSTNLNLFLTQEWTEWLRPAQQEWQKSVRDVVEQVDPQKQWFVVNRYIQREPAIATFVGMEFSEPTGNSIEWKAFLIGDSCLFHIRGDKADVFPELSPKDFGYHPDAFASIELHKVQYTPIYATGTYLPSDIILLATDAIAKWILMQVQASSWPDIVEILRMIHTPTDFQALANNLRMDKELPLENDDVTLMIFDRPE